MKMFERFRITARVVAVLAAGIVCVAVTDGAFAKGGVKSGGTGNHAASASDRTRSVLGAAPTIPIRNTIHPIIVGRGHKPDGHGHKRDHDRERHSEREP